MTRGRRILALTALVGASAVPASVGIGRAQAEASCAPPTPPIYARHADMGGAAPVQDLPADPVDPPPMEGTDLATRPENVGAIPIDTDGSGTPDRVDSTGTPPDELVIERGDGTVRLTAGIAGASIVFLGDYRQAPGDLDHDGRDDLILFVDTGESVGHWYAISGTVTPGNHRVRDVGVLLPGTALDLGVGPGVLGGVTDHVGGPGTDVLARDAHGAGLVAGEDLLAPGPGGSLARFPISMALDGELRGEFDLGDAQGAILLAVGDWEAGPTALRVWRAGRLYDLEPYHGAGFVAYETFRAIDTTQGRFLVSHSGDRGGGYADIVWDLDHLCGPGTPTTVVDPTPGLVVEHTTAPPAAEAVDTDATFTG